MTISAFSVHHRTVSIATQGKSLCCITPQVEAVVQEVAVQTGLCMVFIRHTSASLLIQEGDAAPDVEAFFARLVPEAGQYLLPGEGADDMPAHIRAALTHTSEHIPIQGGSLQLSRLQDIYLWEHRQTAHTREVIVSILGQGD
jgi:secondary thiamine-phosphate synthase enzyme